MNEADFQRLLDASAAATRKHVEDTAAETRKYVEITAAETRKYVEDTAAETRKYVEDTAAETRKYVETTAVETRRHFDVTAEHLNGKIQLVVETVALLDAKVDHIAEDIRDEMRRGFADTHDLIRVSYSSLDRRVTTLERKVAKLGG